MKTSRGLLIASAAAGLIIAGTVTARAAEEGKKGGSMVQCAGINACKGQSSCAGGPGGNACAGKNACKGQGVVDVSSAEECAKKGGKVVESKK
jgi:uncharacterized membrane protein